MTDKSNKMQAENAQLQYAIELTKTLIEPQYVVYCSYKIKGKYLERVVSSVMSWHEATALRVQLQHREINKHGETWSSWTGRIYSRRRVPEMICECYEP